jgi:hypothetical protein
MNARTGKIARLPRSLRLQLNERLERSQPGPKLLAWLNALKEVKQIVQNDFAGIPISKQNLSEWRKGGFEEWLARRDLCEDARDLRELSQDMDDEGSDSVLADDAAMVLAARFGSLIANWNGEVDEKFEAKSRVLNRLCRSIVQLQRGMHRSRREALEFTAKLEEQEKAEKEALKKKMLAPVFNLIKVPPLARIFGGGMAGRKIAEYIMAVRSGNLDADLDLLPTDDFAPAKPAPEEAPKPLPENEMAAEKQDEPTKSQSNPVKPSQTSLTSLSPIGPISPFSPSPASEAGELQQPHNILSRT